MKVGLLYHYPHKFRHGYAVYALKNAKDVFALKAVSQNLMHENLSITDGVYGILADRGIQRQIELLRKMPIIKEAENIDELVLLTKKLLERLEKINLNPNS